MKITILLITLGASALLPSCLSTNSDLATAVESGAPRPVANPVLIKFEPSWLSFQDDPKLPEGVFSAGQLATWKTTALRKTSHSIQPLYSLTSRPGQEGTIEIIREWIYPENGKFLKDWFGTTIKLKADPQGAASRVDLDYAQHLLHFQENEISYTLTQLGKALPKEPSRRQKEAQERWDRFWQQALRDRASVPNHPIVNRTCQFQGLVPDGFYLVQKARGTSKRTDYLICRIFRLDAAGRPLLEEIKPRPGTL